MLYLHSFNRFILISLMLLGLSISSANAAIVGFLDNGTYTTDTFSGLDWLDASASNGRSFDDVSGNFGVGGDFEGWRYASTDEVTLFWDKAGGTPLFTGPVTGHEDWIGDLIDLWGSTDGNTLFTQVLAITGTPHDTESAGVWYANISDNTDDTLNDYAKTLNGFVLEANPRNNFGSALVRNTVPAVPIPAAVWLFGTALIGLVGFGKRRKTV